MSGHRTPDGATVFTTIYSSDYKEIALDPSAFCLMNFSEITYIGKFDQHLHDRLKAQGLVRFERPKSQE